MAGNIEISKEGVKLSYKRFLSDSTPGYALLLLVLLAYWAGLPFPLEEQELRPLGSEAKVLVFVLLFLVATPVGILLNSLSWFLFGGLQIRMAIRLLRLGEKFPLWASRRMFAVETIHPAFPKDDEEQSWWRAYEHVSLLQELISAHHPALAADFEHVEGLRRMARALSLVMLVGTVYFLIVKLWSFALSVFVVGAVLFGLVCVLDVYGCLQIIIRAYSISLLVDRGKHSDAKPFKLDAAFRRLVDAREVAESSKTPADS